MFCTTEGADKPAKYPHLVQVADVLLLNKIDLLAHVDFDVERAIANARQINPQIEILQVSARHRGRHGRLGRPGIAGAPQQAAAAGALA